MARSVRNKSGASQTQCAINPVLNQELVVTPRKDKRPMLQQFAAWVTAFLGEALLQSS